MDIKDSQSDLKKRNNSNINLIAISSVCIMVTIIVLIIYAEENITHELIMDFGKVAFVPIIYYMAKSIITGQLLDYDVLGIKIFFLLIICLICFAVAKWMTSNFSQMVHYFIFISVPAFIGAFHAFYKVGKMDNTDRKKEILEMERISKLD